MEDKLRKKLIEKKQDAVIISIIDNIINLYNNTNYKNGIEDTKREFIFGLFVSEIIKNKPLSAFEDYNEQNEYEKRINEINYLINEKKCLNRTKLIDEMLKNNPLNDI